MSEAEFVECARRKYSQINALKQAPTFHDYEKGFVELWTQLGAEILEADLGPVGADRRKKKSSRPR
ncbi:MAG: hypothetical protein WBA12_07540 [Catalinimonas sp.]